MMPPPSTNQYQLLKQRRFLPYFGVQFLGALNDNIFKTSLLMLIAMAFVMSEPQKANLLTNLSAAAFIFPFFLFSALAGQLADKYEKRILIRYIKLAEIGIALLILVGFYFHHFGFLISVLFLLGTQAAFFSPVKYSVLPQYLANEELVGGNGLVEMGTFVAILLGTILGGVLISMGGNGKWYIAGSVLLFAVIGWLLSFLIPVALNNHSQVPDLKINWEPLTQTFSTLKAAAQKRILLVAMIGISWFWFFGSILITHIPNYTKLFLGGDAPVMTLLLIVLSLGIGIGSLSCERLSGRKEEMGLMVFGAIGLTIFTADLCFAHGPAPLEPVEIKAFLQTWANWHVLMDLFLMGLFAGFYSVPLYVLLQYRSAPEERSRMIAANNILNALFMTIASFFAILLLRAKLTIPQLFLVTSLLNIGMLCYLCSSAPEFFVRFIAWITRK